jgi:hypothetical protein
MVEVEGSIEDVRDREASTRRRCRATWSWRNRGHQHIRNIGGVTGENLGHETRAQSGKAIIAKQEQGSMTTYELFDNYFLAFKLAGQHALANMEQFCNQPWQFRIDPSGMRPPEWVTVNRDPRTGQHPGRHHRRGRPTSSSTSRTTAPR